MKIKLFYKKKPQERVALMSKVSIRICVLTSSFYPVMGGGEGAARLLSYTFSQRGNEVFLITQQRRDDSLRREMLDGFEVIRVGRPGYKRWGKYIMMPAAFFNLVLNANRYDVVYVAGLRTLGVVGVLASKLLGKSCLLRSASCSELPGTYMFEHLNQEWWSQNVIRPMLDIYIRLRNGILLQADGFLAMSHAIAEEYLACAVDPQKIALIPNGVDLTKYFPVGPKYRLELRRRLGLPVQKMIVVYTGKLNRGKGLETLLRSWRLVTSDRTDVCLMLVGSGAEMYLSCEQELREYVEKNKMEYNVIFTGYKNNVQEYLQASDIYVMPSGSEALSNSLIEAISCGLPAVVSAVGGMLDVVTHEYNALLVPVRDEISLAEAIIRLIGDSELRNRLSDAARERAKDYDVSRIVTRYERLFASLASGKGVPCEV